MSTSTEACTPSQNTAVTVPSNHKTKYATRELLTPLQAEIFDAFLKSRGNKIGKTEIWVLNQLLDDSKSAGFRHIALDFATAHYTTSGWPKNSKAFYRQFVGTFMGAARREYRRTGVSKDTAQGQLTDPRRFQGVRHRKIGHT